MQARVPQPTSQAETEKYLREGSGPLADLALTLPLFVVYHLGVVWLDVQNAADVVTRELKALASSSLPAYSGLTLAIGVVFAGILLVLGRGDTLRWQRFALVALEGVLYAVAMRLVASYVVGRVPLDAGVQVAGGSNFMGFSWFGGAPTPPPLFVPSTEPESIGFMAFSWFGDAPTLPPLFVPSTEPESIGFMAFSWFGDAPTLPPLFVPSTEPESIGFMTAVVLSLGAGLYEEIAFRVGLYGLGRKVLLAMMPEALPGQRVLVSLGWAALSAAVFSGWHYVGQFGDPFELRSFVFRWVCGLVFTLIYVFRGFAPVVWTHALYDIWVMAL